MTDAGPVFLFVLLVVVMAVLTLVAAHLLGPRRRTAVKYMPYESGMDPVGDARQRFDIRFYLLAIEFLVFDVELLFLYPWAVAGGGRTTAPTAGGASASLGSEATLRQLVQSTPVFWGVMFFIGLLVAGFAYTWRKGVFQWR